MIDDHGIREACKIQKAGVQVSMSAYRTTFDACLNVVLDRRESKSRRVVQNDLARKST